MLGNSRLYLMVKMAEFRQEEGNRALRIAKYDKRDYIALALVKNFILTTIAYVILVGLVAMFRMDALLGNLSRLRIGNLIGILAVGYFLLLIVFSVVTYIMSGIRYNRARRKVAAYVKQLDVLERIYEEEKRNAIDPFKGA